MAATVQFSTRSYAVGEGYNGEIVQLTRSGPALTAETVEVLVTGLTASLETDFHASPKQVTFAPGQTNSAIRLSVIQDNDVEPPKTASLALANPSAGLSLGNPNEAILTIHDRPATLQLQPTYITGWESVPEALLVEVRRLGTSQDPITINFTTLNGNAKAGEDFVAASGQIDFSAGVTTRILSLTMIDDTLTEGTEYFRIALSNNTPWVDVRVPPVATVSIIDDDYGYIPGTVSLEEGATNFDVPIFRFGSYNFNSTVGYFTTPITATAGVDYLSVTGTVSFAPGETTKSIQVPILNDADRERSETFRLVLTNASHGVPIVTDAWQGNITILDNDRGFRFVSSPIEVDESAGQISVDVFRADDTESAMNIQYHTEPINADAAMDYTPASGNLTFETGDISKSIVIPILNDGLHEARESFRIVLSNPSAGQTLGSPNVATVTIRDNDVGFRFNSDAQLVPEQSLEAVLMVVRDADGGVQSTIDYFLVPDTATPDEDYASITGTLVFPAGLNTNFIKVPILNDGILESSEIFSVVLSNPSSDASLASPNSVSLIIQDDERGYWVEHSPGDWRLLARETDGTVPVQIYREGDFGVSSVSFRVAASNSNGDHIGDAVPGIDFQTDSGVLSFGPGETNKTIALRLLNDHKFELPKTFFILLADPTAGVPIAEPERTVVLLDNERNPLTIDPIFKPEVPYRQGLSSLPGSRVVMGTDLRSLTGEDGLAVVRLLPDGTMDPTFHPAVVGPYLEKLVAHTNSQIYVVGPAGMTINSIPVPYLARLNPDGKLDRSFRLAPAAQSTPIVTLLVEPEGKLVVATDKFRLFRLHTDGAVDTLFQPLAADGSIRRIVLERGTNFLVWGDFLSINGQPRPRLARVLSDGLLDDSFLWFRNLEPVENFHPQMDGNILVRIQGSTRSRLARLLSSGELDPEFQPFECASEIDFFTSTPDGKVLISRPTSDGIHGVFRLAQDGTPDTSFAPGTFNLFTDFWSSFAEISPEPDGAWLLSGSFTAVNGHARPNIARLLVHSPPSPVVLDDTTLGVLETNGIVQVKLLRTGETSAPLTVDWNTDGGSARFGIDYVPAAGKLTFQIDQSELYLLLSLLDNPEPAGDRTLRLRMATQAGIDLPPVDLTILEDDLGFLRGGSRALRNGRFLLTITGHRNRPNLRIQRSLDLVTWENLFWWPFLDSPLLDLNPNPRRSYYRIIQELFQ
jgi:hypothetical protein